MEDAPGEPDEQLDFEGGDAAVDGGGGGEGAAAAPGEEGTEPASLFVVADEPAVELPPERELTDEERALLEKPPHSTEVFFGGVARPVAQAELRSLAETVGDVHDVRMPVDPASGHNRGYAFVTYVDAEAAARAVAELHGKQLQGKAVRVSLSQSKYKLFVGNLPFRMDTKVLERHVANVSGGLISLLLPEDKRATAAAPDGEQPKRRSFGFAEYHNNQLAQRAFKAFQQPGLTIGGRKPVVSWAEPKQPPPEVPELENIKSIFVRGIPPGTSTEQLQKLYTQFGYVQSVDIPRPKGNTLPTFAFVHFEERSSAIAACDAEEPQMLGDSTLEVKMARPMRARGDEHGGDRRGPFSSNRDRGVGGARNDDGHRGFARNADYADYGSSRQGPPVGAVHAAPNQMHFGMAPVGGAMVPMMLPNGQVGYIMQPQPSAGATAEPDGYGADDYRGRRSEYGRHDDDRKYDRRDGRRDGRYEQGGHRDRERRYRPY